MKRMLVAAVLASALLATSAFAATPATEPKLPSDIGTYGLHEAMCDKYAGRAFVERIYSQKLPDGSINSFNVIILNGKKVSQIEYSQFRSDNPKIFIYVRNSPKKNWLKFKFDESEHRQFDERIRVETGLTREQIHFCKK